MSGPNAKKLWIYNPLAEEEIATGGSVYPKRAHREAERAGEALLGWLAGSEDLLWVREPPASQWLARLAELGLGFPRLIHAIDGPALAKALVGMHVGEISPWGWSPTARRRLGPLLDLPNLLSAMARDQIQGAGDATRWDWGRKDWIAEWAPSQGPLWDIFGAPRSTVARTEGDAHGAITQMLRKGQSVVCKAPWGTGGRSVFRILAEPEWEQAPGTRVRRILKKQGSIVLMPELPVHGDVGLHGLVDEEGPRILGARRFLVSSRWHYAGSILGPVAETAGWSPVAWHEFGSAVGDFLWQQGYRGPYSLDGILWQAEDGLRLHPASELNLRWTMGRIGLALEKFVEPGTPAVWFHLNGRIARELGAKDASELFTQWHHDNPDRWSSGMTGPVLVEGVFPTQPLGTERGSVLLVGEAALAPLAGCELRGWGPIGP